MRVTREVTVGGRSVHVKELTVGEVRAWLRGATSSGSDIVDALLFEEFDPPGILQMTDLTLEQFDQLLPSEIRALAEHCRELNPDFFSMRRRMVKAQETLLAGLSNAAH